MSLEKDVTVEKNSVEEIVEAGPVLKEKQPQKNSKDKKNVLEEEKNVLFAFPYGTFLK